MGGLLLIDFVFAGNGQFVPVKRELLPPYVLSESGRMRNTASVDSLSVAVPKVSKFLSTSSRSMCRVPRMIPLSLSACTIVNRSACRSDKVE